MRYHYIITIQSNYEMGNDQKTNTRSGHLRSIFNQEETFNTIFKSTCDYFSTPEEFTHVLFYRLVSDEVTK
jgi:hypothetical protein